ncbi:MAG: type IV pilus secretin PilQ, partial [Gammaproteobacteria bacterium]
MKLAGLRDKLVLGCASVAIGFGSSAIASELESMNVMGSQLRQVVEMQFDDYPRYEIVELSDGNGIVITFRDTSVAADYQAPASLGNGLITNIEANANNGDMEVEISLDSASKYTLTRSDSGYQLSLIPLERLTQDTSGKAAQLNGLAFARVSGDRVRIDLNIEGDVGEPVVFRTVEPPRIALDFFGMTNNSGKQVHRVGISSVESLVLAEDEDRMRMILNLQNPADYSIEQVDQGLILTVLASASVPATVTDSSTVTRSENFELNEGAEQQHQINNVDFRRTPTGAGRVIVTLSDNELAVDLQEIGGEIVAVFPNTILPPELEQRLDVMDFATPVSTIDTFADGKNVRLVITPSTGQYKQSSVQSGDTLIVDISPLSQAELEAERADEFGYTGERLSLNFQQISVRAALQVIADFTGLNFVTSDAISGNLSLRLKDVPWDQALDVILQTKGLAMRQKGNVVWVAPAEEIADKERQALEAKQEVGELAPLVSELIPISYAKAEEVAGILRSIKAVDTGLGTSAFGSVNVSEIKTEENTLLSSRGSVTVDKRTNSLLIQDTAQKLREIRELIAQLDIPVRQVQIETRIVEAIDAFSRNIGARLAFATVTQDAETLGGVKLGEAFTGATVNSNADTRLEGTLDNSDALSINLPAGSIDDDPAASYAFSLAKFSSGFLSLLDLEISALQAEGSGRIIANPKILTTDKTEASIEQGQERLTVFGSAFGTSATEGQKAVLILTVRPQIRPDDKITLDVDITNDSFAGVDDTVNTKRIQTQTLLENGETVVIGGIYQQEESESVSKVPLLGDIPFLGNLFKKR